MANHGGVCIFFRLRFTVRRISLPHHQSAEVLAVYVQGEGVNLIVVGIYHPGSLPVDSVFLREFATIVERVATMSAPVVIVGDVNIHLDGPTSLSTNNFNDIILGYAGLLNETGRPGGYGDETGDKTAATASDKRDGSDRWGNYMDEGPYTIDVRHVEEMVGTTREAVDGDRVRRG